MSSAGTQQHRKADSKGRAKPLSLNPVPFGEAVADVVAAKPLPEKKKRRGKGRKPKEYS